MTVSREKTGEYKKGVSGNPSGRPKSIKLTAAIRKKFDKIKDPNKKFEALMHFLIDSSETKDEMFKYLKEFMPYIKPKLKNVETKIQQVTDIKISWGAAQPPPPKVVKEIITKEIEKEKK